MMTAGKTVRGLGLISGGLDSMLAARLLMEQGIAVTGIAITVTMLGYNMLGEGLRDALDPRLSE